APCGGARSSGRAIRCPRSPAGAPGTGTARCRPRSDPAAVDDVALARTRRAVVGGEEEHDARDVLREELALQTLAPDPLLLALGREPELDLALGHDPAGHDRVHADVHGAEVSGERAGQPGDSGLGAE